MHVVQNFLNLNSLSVQSQILSEEFLVGSIKFGKVVGLYAKLVQKKFAKNVRALKMQSFPHTNHHHMNAFSHVNFARFKYEHMNPLVTFLSIYWIYTLSFLC